MTAKPIDMRKTRVSLFPNRASFACLLLAFSLAGCAEDALLEEAEGVDGQPLEKADEATIQSSNRALQLQLCDTKTDDGNVMNGATATFSTTGICATHYYVNQDQYTYWTPKVVFKVGRGKKCSDYSFTWTFRRTGANQTGKVSAKSVGTTCVATATFGIHALSDKPKVTLGILPVPAGGHTITSTLDPF